jgi:death-on-curing family protein
MEIDIDDELNYQLDRALSQVVPISFGDMPPYAISIKDVLVAHFMIADFFYRSGEGIGGVGPRDMSLLQSTVDRQRVSLGDQWKWTTPYELAATLLFGLVRNHPFFDANKRTGIVSCANLLLKQKIALTLREDQMVKFTEDVASHDLQKYPTYRELVRQGFESAEIVFIARYLRKNSRSLSSTHHSITFRELITTLKKYGYELTDPKGNTIDVVFIGGATKSPNIETGHKLGDRVCNMGFPGYSKQVTKGDLKHVRNCLYLLPEYGVDSDAFFEGADPLTNLISSYEGALRKLAFR